MYIYKLIQSFGGAFFVIFIFYYFFYNYFI